MVKVINHIRLMQQKKNKKKKGNLSTLLTKHFTYSLPSIHLSSKRIEHEGKKIERIEINEFFLL